jgi:hypothetical protein
MVQVPLFIGSILSRYPMFGLCGQFRQKFVDLSGRKSGLIANPSQGHHDRPSPLIGFVLFLAKFRDVFLKA